MFPSANCSCRKYYVFRPSAKKSLLMGCTCSFVFYSFFLWQCRLLPRTAFGIEICRLVNYHSDLFADVVHYYERPCALDICSSGFINRHELGRTKWNPWYEVKTPSQADIYGSVAKLGRQPELSLCYPILSLCFRKPLSIICYKSCIDFHIKMFF